MKTKLSGKYGDFKHFLHESFEIGIFLKGLDGLLEIVGGILLLLVSRNTLNHLAVLLTQHELSRDPNDFFANYLVRAAHDLSLSTQIFGSLYLLSHGVIKIFIIISLWKKKLWAYPMAIFFFVLFAVYQVYRYTFDPSIGLIILTVFDVFIIVLTWIEYRGLESRKAENPRNDQTS